VSRVRTGVRLSTSQPAYPATGTAAAIRNASAKWRWSNSLPKNGIISPTTRLHTPGAGEISQAADDLSRRTEQQAASLEQTTATLTEVTAAVKASAEGSQHARQVVAAADEDPAAVRHFIEERGARYPVVLDEHAQTAAAWGVIGLPTYVVLLPQK